MEKEINRGMFCRLMKGWKDFSAEGQRELDKRGMTKPRVFLGLQTGRGRGTPGVMDFDSIQRW